MTSKKFFFLLTIGLGLLSTLQPARAVILAEEDFSHPDGNLVGNSPDPGPGEAWTAHTDAGNTPIQVIDGMATLSQGKGSGGREDANLEFVHQSVDATTYARFDFMLPGSANGDIVNLDPYGSNFAHLKSDRLTNHFRARTGVLTPAGDGDFRLAINANGSRLNEGTAWPVGLDFDTMYRVVVNWNAVSGESKLWLNPVDELSASISHTGHSTGQTIESFALRQSSDYTATQYVDNLVVATTFAEALLGSDPVPTYGDFDGDNDVDGADFLKWQRGELPNPLSQSDLADWEAYYGTDTRLVSASLNALPEPSCAVMVFGFVSAIFLRRRNKCVI